MYNTIIAVLFLFITLTACQTEFTGDFIEWGEKTNSNAAELLKDHGIPYEIKDGRIYIPEDAIDKAIFCCA